jgi:hypothetical protein
MMSIKVMSFSLLERTSLVTMRHPMILMKKTTIDKRNQKDITSVEGSPDLQQISARAVMLREKECAR